MTDPTDRSSTEMEGDRDSDTTTEAGEYDGYVTIQWPASSSNLNYDHEFSSIPLGSSDDLDDGCGTIIEEEYEESTDENSEATPPNLNNDRYE